jgi:hypothetical protein
VPQFQGNAALRRDLLPRQAPADAPSRSHRRARRSALLGKRGRRAGADRRRQAQAIFPTRRNLERLAGFASFEEACADAARHEVRTITPWVERREGRKFVCIPQDAGYPVTCEPFETARRR